MCTVDCALYLDIGGVEERFWDLEALSSKVLVVTVGELIVDHRQVFHDLLVHLSLVHLPGNNRTAVNRQEKCTEELKYY